MVRDGSMFDKCKNEQEFKIMYVNKVMKKDFFTFQRVFCIETEETVQGFPDVMEVITSGEENFVYFYEFKYANASGVIKFQPTQPSFFKRNAHMNIGIVALNKKTGKLHQFYTKELFDPDSPYYMSMKAEVNLTSVEKQLYV